MRLSFASTIIALSIVTGDAFSPSLPTTIALRASSSALSSTVQTRPAPAEIQGPDDNKKSQSSGIVPLTGDEINDRRDAQLKKLRMKDKTSIQLEKEVGYGVLFY